MTEHRPGQRPAGAEDGPETRPPGDTRARTVRVIVAEMPRARLALTAGVLLLIASCLLPCLPLLDLSGVSMPYQDPTPGMIEKQTADIAAAEHRLALHAAIAGALALLGLAAFFYAWKHRRSLKADRGIQTKRQT